MRTEQPITVSQFYLVHQAFKNNNNKGTVNRPRCQGTRYLGGGGP